MSGRTVFIVAGEASGDRYGAQIAERLRERDPDLRLLGMGGGRMRAAGVETLVDAEPLGVVGLVEVLRHLPALRAALRRLDDALRQSRPDLVILIDYQEFNLALARRARAAGLRTLFYIAPQAWAWRPRRLRRYRGAVDRMAVIFPFEVELCRAAGIAAEYVGHPLCGRVAARRPPAETRARLGLADCRAVVALLPGSRRGEIRRLLPLMLDAAQRLEARCGPGLGFVLPVAHARAGAQIEAVLARRPPRDLRLLRITEDHYDAVAAADCAAVASGTATLETALLGVPLAIVYRVSPLSHALLRPLLRVERVGLPNIIAGREVAPELIQGDARPDRLAARLAQWLEDPAARAAARADLETVKARLGERDGLSGVSELAWRMLNETR
ncbi:MAG: lipid-A-disaccharide synthase [Gammaproteobacteria bacterium]|nr:MAG: lipid-A-disaccharide synthase [Gammaproteobacteria bacterium]